MQEQKKIASMKSSIVMADPLNSGTWSKSAEHSLMITKGKLWHKNSTKEWSENEAGFREASILWFQSFEMFMLIAVKYDAFLMSYLILPSKMNQHVVEDLWLFVLILLNVIEAGCRVTCSVVSDSRDHQLVLVPSHLWQWWHHPTVLTPSESDNFAPILFAYVISPHGRVLIREIRKRPQGAVL